MQINPNIYNKPIAQIDKNANDLKLKEQTDSFESLILKNLLDVAIKMEDSILPKEAGGEIYNSMYKDTIAQSLSGTFGYSKLLYDYLKEQQK